MGRGRIVAVCWVLLAGLAPQAQAQLKVAYEEAGVESDLRILALRPNVDQPLYFHYHNPGPGGRKNVDVTLELLGPGDKAKPIATAKIPAVAAKKSMPVIFAAGGAKDAKDAPWPALDAPFRLRFRVEAQGSEPVVTDVDVRIQEPRNYIEVEKAHFDKSKRRLSVKLKWNQAAPPTIPIPVELELLEAHNPGLKKPKAGAFRQVISAENRSAELTAEGVEFDGGIAPKNGRIMVSVDGHRRAFLFKCTYEDGDLPSLADDNRARLVAPRYSLPSPKLPVTLEIDATTLRVNKDTYPENALVEVQFDATGDGNYRNVPGSPFRGLRAQSVGYKIDGPALLLRTGSADRVATLNVEGIVGKRSLKVRLLSAGTAGSPIDIADEEGLRDERSALYDADPKSAFAPLKFLKSDRAVVADLVIDDSPTKILKLVDLPEKAAAGDKVRPQVRLEGTGANRGPDQAPIGKVVFFLGEADKNHKIPEKEKENLVPATYDAKLGTWIASEDLVLPNDPRGKVVIGVHVVTALDVPNSGKQTIPLFDPKAAAAEEANKLCVVRGTVLHGERAQPKQDVYLAKAKAMKDDEPKLVVTDENGAFVFRDVPPGNYVLVAVGKGPHAGKRARATITIMKGQQKSDGHELSLRAGG